MMQGIKVAVVGGGTGLSTMLRGIKKYTSEITAIVTVSDNGGGSGVLRKEMNILPPGDIRNCIMALSNTEPIMEKLFKYRFKKGSLEGQSFGNLFLAAMTDVLGNFEEAVQHTSEVLNITGKVLPVTSEDVQLCARLQDGSIICGESEIVDNCKAKVLKIEEVFLLPNQPKPLDDAIESILDADLIVLGPGSLYTSIIPNFLVSQIASAIKKSKAHKVYIGNVMTQPGETDGYNLKQHVEAIEKYLGKDIIEYIIVNSTLIPEEYVDNYKDDHASPVPYLLDNFKNTSVKIVERDIIKLYSDKKLVRHDSEKLAKAIFDLYNDIQMML